MNSQRIPTDANLFALPIGLPAPEDDGAARHLPGASLPHVRLRSTQGRTVDIAELGEHLSVFFFYPATVQPRASRFPASGVKSLEREDAPSRTVPFGTNTRVSVL